MLKQLYVTPQSVTEGLTVERAGTQFRKEFPVPIQEQPYLGQTYELSTLALKLTHIVRLKTAQTEAFPIPLDCSFELIKNGEVVGIWGVSFQMRLVPGTEGREWVGESPISVDLTNSLDYSSGDKISFAVAGVVPGNIGGPQTTAQEEREKASLEQQAEILNQLIANGEGTDETVTTLEEILTRLNEME